MTKETEADAFALSRAYAQGWNAAKRPWTLEASGRRRKVKNPYTSEPERARWNEGFALSQTGR
jgi:hypothetical protein